MKAPRTRAVTGGAAAQPDPRPSSGLAGGKAGAGAAPAARTAASPRPGKAAHAGECLHLRQLPNVGPAMTRDLQVLGIHRPADLVGQDAYTLYRALERHTGAAQDPCVLDTFMAIVDFMNGAHPRPWWDYTAERKRRHGDLHPAPG